MKSTSCNGEKSYSFTKAPRCGARTKRNNGMPCRSPAVRGKNRCRIHGGSKGSGARPANANALKHGFNTAAVKHFKKAVKLILMESHELIKKINQ